MPALLEIRQIAKLPQQPRINLLHIRHIASQILLQLADVGAGVVEAAGQEGELFAVGWRDG